MLVTRLTPDPANHHPEQQKTIENAYRQKSETDPSQASIGALLKGDAILEVCGDDGWYTAEELKELNEVLAFSSQESDLSFSDKNS